MLLQLGGAQFGTHGPPARTCLAAKALAPRRALFATRCCQRVIRDVSRRCCRLCRLFDRKGHDQVSLERVGCAQQEGVIAEALESSRLVGAELGQILTADEVAVGLQIPHRSGEVDDVLNRNPVTSVVIPAIMADVEEVEVVVAHHERATLRVGDVFLKIDADQTRTDVEVEAMAMAPIPTPEVLWRKPPVLALAALPGTALGRLGEPSTASPAAWAAAGAAARMLHDAPLPPWPGRSLDEIASHLDGECEWLVTNGVLPTDLVTRNRRVAEAALRPWTPVFTHGDLQITHVFVDGDEITGVIDWSEAGQGDALYDLAT